MLMPRPQPIIIPGQGGMGMNLQQHQSEINLSALLKLYEATIGKRRREQQDIAAGEAIANVLQPGIPAQPGGEAFEQPAGPGTPPGFGVNLPDRPAQPSPLAALAQSGLGRKTLAASLTKVLGEGGAGAEAFSTPRMYQTDAGEYRWGFFSKTARPQMVQDIRKATEKEIKGTLRVELTGLQKSTKGQLEKQIIEAGTNIQQFDAIEELFDPTYLTYKGKGLAQLQRVGEKLGLEFDAQYLENRTRWFQQAKTAFLEWRKWVTGVAGGPEEMKEIAKSFPDPERNSPTEFTANLDQARIWTQKLQKRLAIFRFMGIENPTKKQLATLPLSMITLDNAGAGVVAPSVGGESGQPRFKVIKRE